MVVFSTDRPVRCETILKADAHGATPARRTCRNQTDPAGCVEYVKAIAGYSRAAIDREEPGSHAPTDLPRENADATTLHAGRGRRLGQGDRGIAAGAPHALRFQSKHKLIG